MNYNISLNYVNIINSKFLIMSEFYNKYYFIKSLQLFKVQSEKSEL